MRLDLSPDEMMALSRVATIAIEDNLPKICTDPGINPKALLSAAGKLHRAALEFALGVTPAGLA